MSPAPAGVILPLAVHGQRGIRQTPEKLTKLCQPSVATKDPGTPTKVPPPSMPDARTARRGTGERPRASEDGSLVVFLFGLRGFGLAAHDKQARRCDEGHGVASERGDKSHLNADRQDGGAE